jgi:hypothetical protein
MKANEPSVKNPAARKPGRPSYAPTEKDREQAKMLSGMGVTGEQIAALLGISEPTLHKYFQKELDTGYIQANAQVAQSLFRQATDKTKPNVIAAIFWMKTRGGWRESLPAEGGKKDQLQAEAESIASGKFGARQPPKLVASR